MPLLLFFLLAFQIPTSDPIQTFAQALISAKTENERASLLQQNKTLVGVPLREALLKNVSPLTSKGEYEEAREICELILQIATSINDQKGTALTLIQRGRTFIEEEKYEDAERDSQQALKIGRSLPDEEVQAQSLQNLGKIRYEEQKWEAALRYFEQTLGLYRKLKDPLGQARTLNLMANVYDFYGNPKKALELYEQSLKLFNEIHDSKGAAGVLVNRGTVYSDMGQNYLAIESYAKAEKVYEAAGEKPNLAIVLNNTGNCFTDLGNYRLALQYHLRALKLREELGATRGIIGSKINIGFIHEKQGNYDLSLDLYLQAETLAKKVGNQYLEGVAVMNVGGIYAFMGRYDTAHEYYRKSLPLREQINDKAGVASVFYATGGTYELMGEYEKAPEYYLKSLTLYEELNMKARAAEVLLGLSTVHFAQNNFEESERFAERAHELSKEIEFADLQWAVLSQQAKILMRKAENDRAETKLQEAIEAVESLRQQVVGAETATQQFLASREQPFYLMIELLVQQNRNAEAFQYAERIRGRVLMDVLKSGRAEVTKQMSIDEAVTEQNLTSELKISNALLQGEKAKEKPDTTRLTKLRNQLQTARMALERFQTNLYATHPLLKTQRGEISSINENKISSLVRKEDAILEYSVSKERTFLFLWTRTEDKEAPRLNVITIPIKQNALAELTKFYRQQLEKRDLRVAQTSQKLYDILMRPAEQHFTAKKSILIVPDRELWELPFQSLQSQTTGQSVLERFSISYAPSLNVLYEMRNTPNKLTASSALLALASSIPHAEREVNTLAQFYGRGRSRIYTGQNAREGILKKEASGFEIIHLATHGVLDDSSPMYSYLEFSNEKTEDGLLEPWEVMNLDLNTSLVILSSCESGRGKIGSGEGIIGFTWALFVAGSRSTVVSEWKVDSESTAVLMLEFHRNLTLKKLSKSEALRQAALKVRANPKYRHPYYWAPFIVLGDPSAI